jgi:hypothetical protein
MHLAEQPWHAAAPTTSIPCKSDGNSGWEPKLSIASATRPTDTTANNLRNVVMIRLLQGGGLGGPEPPHHASIGFWLGCFVRRLSDSGNQSLGFPNRLVQRADFDPARLHSLRHLAHEVDVQQAVVERRPHHLDVISEAELSFEGTVVPYPRLRVPESCIGKLDEGRARRYPTRPRQKMNPCLRHPTPDSLERAAFAPIRRINYAK